MPLQFLSLADLRCNNRTGCANTICLVQLETFEAPFLGSAMAKRAVPLQALSPRTSGTRPASPQVHAPAHCKYTQKKFIGEPDVVELLADWLVSWGQMPGASPARHHAVHRTMARFLTTAKLFIHVENLVYSST